MVLRRSQTTSENAQAQSRKGSEKKRLKFALEKLPLEVGYNQRFYEESPRTSQSPELLEGGEFDEE
jgi:hypothetical protein